MHGAGLYNLETDRASVLELREGELLIRPVVRDGGNLLVYLKLLTSRRLQANVISIRVLLTRAVALERCAAVIR